MQSYFCENVSEYSDLSYNILGATVPRIDHGRRNSPRDRQTDRADRRAGHDRQRPQTDRRSSPESAISDAINSQEQSG